MINSNGRPRCESYMIVPKIDVLMLYEKVGVSELWLVVGGSQMSVSNRLTRRHTDPLVDYNRHMLGYQNCMFHIPPAPIESTLFGCPDLPVADIR